MTKVEHVQATCMYKCACFDILKIQFSILQFGPLGHGLWWNSHPLLKFGIQRGHFTLATNKFFSGNKNKRKIPLLFQLMDIRMVAESTFFPPNVCIFFCYNKQDSIHLNIKIIPITL